MWATKSLQYKDMSYFLFSFWGVGLDNTSLELGNKFNCIAEKDNLLSKQFGKPPIYCLICVTQFWTVSVGICGVCLESSFQKHLLTSLRFFMDMGGERTGMLILFSSLWILGFCLSSYVYRVKPGSAKHVIGESRSFICTFSFSLMPLAKGRFSSIWQYNIYAKCNSYYQLR